MANSNVAFTSQGPISTPSQRVINARVFDMIDNAVKTRRKFIEGMSDDRRSINDECGYPSTENLTPEMYYSYYEREPIAARVVEVMPKECWVVEPEIYEDEDVTTETEFEVALNDLVQNLRGQSWYRKQKGNPLFEFLRRSDILCGIGSYGIIVLGINDDKPLSESVDWIDERGNVGTIPKDTKLLYQRTFPERFAEIAERETDKSNPRYGQPVRYRVTFEEPNYSHDSEGETNSSSTISIHWTRVVHIVDNLNASEIFSTPRMRPVFNRLYDLRKLYGGSAEMYWRGAFPGLAINTLPQIAGNVEVDLSATKDSIEQYMNTLQRYLLLDGLDAKSLAPQVVDPSSQIEVQINAICIEKEIPKRIFMGSERGELASSQDAIRWNRVVAGRQNRICTPRIIVPYIDRLIMLGVLPEPGEDGYCVKWPDLNSLSSQDQAQVALTRTDALSKYVAGSVETIIAPMDYLIRFLGLSSEEAEEIIQAALDNDLMTIPEEEPLVTSSPTQPGVQ